MYGKFTRCSVWYIAAFIRVGMLYPLSLCGRLTGALSLAYLQTEKLTAVQHETNTIEP